MHYDFLTSTGLSGITNISHAAFIEGCSKNGEGSRDELSDDSRTLFWCFILSSERSWSIASLIPPMHSSQVNSLSCFPAPHIHSAVGSKYPGQRTGSPATQPSGSSACGQISARRTSTWVATDSALVRAPAMVETTFTQSS